MFGEPNLKPRPTDTVEKIMTASDRNFEADRSLSAVTTEKLSQQSIMERLAENPYYQSIPDRALF